MSIDQLLKKPIKWSDWAADSEIKSVLDELQSNILKGHGRSHTANMFLAFDRTRRQDVAEGLAWIGQAMAPALFQLLEAEAHKTSGAKGRQIVCLMLSASGYQALGLLPPGDPAFRAGMRARAPAIGDMPDAGGWQAELAQPVDGLLLFADVNEDEVTKAVARWTRFLAKHRVAVAHVERGRAQKREFEGNPKPEGVEHFGYVDGRSQPLFLAEQVEGEPIVWDPAFPPSQFIVRDPHGTSDACLGSYFVFRKLEQNVRGFKEREEALAAAMGLVGEDAERAGALVVGRFENGTPIVFPRGEPIPEPPPNNFDYSEDPAGDRCPFRGHTRKTNPRGSTGRADERSHIMARRGITYGDRAPGEMDDGDTQTKPVGGVGLLFMAYMANIERQFEFTQNIWANNRDFPVSNAGTDPVIGMGPQAAEVPWRDGHGHSTPDFDFRDFVAMRGGEYFFAPCMSFLRRLDEIVH